MCGSTTIGLRAGGGRVVAAFCRYRERFPEHDGAGRTSNLRSGGQPPALPSGFSNHRATLQTRPGRRSGAGSAPLVLLGHAGAPIQHPPGRQRPGSRADDRDVIADLHLADRACLTFAVGLEVDLHPRPDDLTFSDPIGGLHADGGGRNGGHRAADLVVGGEFRSVLRHPLPVDGSGFGVARGRATCGPRVLREPPSVIPSRRAWTRMPRSQGPERRGWLRRR